MKARLAKITSLLPALIFSIHGFPAGLHWNNPDCGTWFDPNTDCNFLHSEFQIHKLQSENMQIRQQTGSAHPVAPPPNERPDHSHVAPTATGALRRDRHAFSMYEPGTSALKPFGQQVMDDLVGRLQPFHPGVSVSVHPRSPSDNLSFHTFIYAFQ